MKFFALAERDFPSAILDEWTTPLNRGVEIFDEI
jgi:hypothetical protein